MVNDEQRYFGCLGRGMLRGDFSRQRTGEAFICIEQQTRRAFMGVKRLKVFEFHTRHVFIKCNKKVFNFAFRN